MYRKPGQNAFVAFPSTGALSHNGDSIIIDSVPIDIRVQVTDINPKPASAALNMRLGNEIMLKQGATTFEKTISDTDDQTITISVTDEQGTTSERVLNVSLNQSLIQ